MGVTLAQRSHVVPAPTIVRHSRGRGNPATRAARESRGERHWVPAYAGTTIQVEAGTTIQVEAGTTIQMEAGTTIQVEAGTTIQVEAGTTI